MLEKLYHSHIDGTPIQEVDKQHRPTIDDNDMTQKFNSVAKMATNM